MVFDRDELLSDTKLLCLNSFLGLVFTGLKTEVCLEVDSLDDMLLLL